MSIPKRFLVCLFFANKFDILPIFFPRKTFFFEAQNKAKIIDIFTGSIMRKTNSLHCDCEARDNFLVYFAGKHHSRRHFSGSVRKSRENSSRDSELDLKVTARTFRSSQFKERSFNEKQKQATFYQQPARFRS